MKRNRLLSLLSLSVISLFVLQSNQNGYSSIVAHNPTASAGGCNCHGPANSSQNDALKVEVIDGNNNSVSHYVANTNYTVRVTLKKGNAFNAAGMQATIFDAGTTQAAGTISNGTLIKAENIGGTVVANHTQRDISTLKVGANVTWEFPWKAPLINQNDVQVSVIANDANDDQGTGGDAVIYNSKFLSKNPNAVEDFSKGIEAIYPNPTTESINIDLTSSKASNVSIYSITGQLVKQTTAKGNKIKLNVSDLTNGNYIIAIAQDGNYARQQFVKY